jgi:uncharacterized membrane protein
MMVFMLILVALSIDIGYMCLAKTELQESADAAPWQRPWISSTTRR